MSQPTEPSAEAAAVTLRPMRWWDIPAVHHLEQELFQADPWSESMFWSELAGVPESRWYVVAERAGTVVAYAGLLAIREEADIQTVAVHPDEQGTGLSGRLMDALLAEAGTRGCTQVFLEVRAENVPAQRLYEKYGFDQVAVRRGYYGPDADGIVMRLNMKDQVPSSPPTPKVIR